MRNAARSCFALVLTAFLAFPPATVQADTGETTRVADAKQLLQTKPGGYPYRERSDYVLKELDLKPGDAVVDIGAGDGWWTEKIAAGVGEGGVVYAAEVAQGKIDQLSKKFADLPQVRPLLIPLDGTALEENAVDLVFLSKTYHHFNEGGHVDYLRHLNCVVRPTGRLVVIEHYLELATGRARDHAWSPGLLTQQAEEAGWILLRCELIAGTNHFIAIFVQKDLFGIEPAGAESPKPARKR